MALLLIFLLDTWFNDYRLSLQYLLVYDKTKIATSTIRDVWNNSNIKLNLTRGAGIVMRQENIHIITLLNSL
jgi:hypothetical protein